MTMQSDLMQTGKKIKMLEDKIDRIRFTLVSAEKDLQRHYELKKQLERIMAKDKKDEVAEQKAKRKMNVRFLLHGELCMLWSVSGEYCLRTQGYNYNTKETTVVWHKVSINKCRASDVQKAEKAFNNAEHKVDDGNECYFYYKGIMYKRQSNGEYQILRKYGKEAFTPEQMKVVEKNISDKMDLGEIKQNDYVR